MEVVNFPGCKVKENLGNFLMDCMEDSDGDFVVFLEYNNQRVYIHEDDLDDIIAWLEEYRDA